MRSMTLEAQRRAPASGGDPRQLVVLAHGYGANGQDLIGLAEPLSQALPDAQFVSPDAPETVPGYPAGRQWFPLAQRTAEELSNGVRTAGPVLDAFIDAELERYGLIDEDLALIGFSQGTMLMLHVGLRRDPGPAAIVGFSGALAAPETLKDEIKARPPVFLAHGDADPVVPHQAMNQAAAALADAGLSVICRKTPGLQHAIAPEGFQIAASFLKQAFDGTLEIPPGAHNVMASSQKSG